MLKLAGDLISLVTSFLEPLDVLRLCPVSKQMNGNLQSPAIWSKYIERGEPRPETFRYFVCNRKPRYMFQRDSDVAQVLGELSESSVVQLPPIKRRAIQYVCLHAPKLLDLLKAGTLTIWELRE